MYSNVLNYIIENYGMMCKSEGDVATLRVTTSRTSASAIGK